MKYFPWPICSQEICSKLALAPTRSTASASEQMPCHNYIVLRNPYSQVQIVKIRLAAGEQTLSKSGEISAFICQACRKSKVWTSSSFSLPSQSWALQSGDMLCLPWVKVQGHPLPELYFQSQIKCGNLALPLSFLSYILQVTSELYISVNPWKGIPFCHFTQLFLVRVCIFPTIEGPPFFQ